MFGKKEINKSRAWKRLEHHYKSMRKVEMRDMFRKDPQRAERYSINLEGLMLDYPKSDPPIPMFTIFVSFLPVCPVNSPNRTASENLRILANTALISGITSLPST